MNKSLRIKPVIFAIIGLSLISLAVTNVLQQQTAMAKPKFDNTDLGKVCSLIYDAWQDADEAADEEDATQEDKDLAIDYMFLYAKHCGDKYGTKGLSPDLKADLDKLLEDSKVPQTGGTDLLEEGMMNTTKK